MQRYISEVIEGSFEQIDRCVKDVTKQRLCGGLSSCSCSVCRSVEQNLSPNCSSFGGKVLSIGDVRKAIDGLGWKCTTYRAVVLKAKAAVSDRCANSLLKLIEEPPENTQVFLGVPSQWLLPSTVLSRCSVRQLSLDNDNDALYTILGNSVEEQMRIIRGWVNEKEFRFRAISMVQTLWEQGRYTEAYYVGSCARHCSDSRSSQMNFISVLQDKVRA